MPDTLELPGLLFALPPEVLAVGISVRELVAYRLPGPAAVIAALDHGAVPGGPQGGMQPIRVVRGGLEVEHLPSAEVRTADLPTTPAGLRREDESPLACSDEHADLCHRSPSRSRLPSTRHPGPPPPTRDP